jgi:tRNA G18 (ribose-2'-O)-methylase SpoU
MSTSSSAPPSARRRLTGSAELARALDAGLPVRCVVVPEGPLSAELGALCERASAAGAEILRSGERRRTRLAGDAEVAALVGPELDGDLDAVMARGGAVWLIVGARYPGNVGTAIRTAEVSGADGFYIDSHFDHAQRRETRRASMRADRFLPVAWERAGDVIGAARRAGKRIVAIEDSGTAAPWEVSLTGPLLLVAGGESDGIPPALQRRCDAVTRIPMEGFVSSYNLQAAVAIVAAERLRQSGGSPR